MKFINYMLLTGISLMFSTVNAAEIVSNPENWVAHEKLPFWSNLFADKLQRKFRLC